MPPKRDAPLMTLAATPPPEPVAEDEPTRPSPGGQWVKPTRWEADRQETKTRQDALSADSASDEFEVGVDPNADEYASGQLVEPTRQFHLVDGHLPGEPDESEDVDEDRAPIVPEWLKTRVGRRGMVGHLTGTAWYWVAFHGIRLPWYGLLLLGLSPRGTARIARRITYWCGDHGQDLQREQLTATIDRTGNAGLQATALDMARAHRWMIAGRWLAVSVALAIGWVLLTNRLADLALWQQAAVGVGTGLAVGMVGRDPTRPVLSTAIYAGARPLRPTPELVRWAPSVTPSGASVPTRLAATTGTRLLGLSWARRALLADAATAQLARLP